MSTVLYPFFIGITGRAGAGKDTVADMLESAIYQHLSWSSNILPLAAPLKAAASALYDVPLHKFNNREFKEVTIPEHGLSPRQMLQLMGEGLRSTLGKDAFTKLVDVAIEQSPPQVVTVVPDIRHQDEAEWILSKPDSILIVLSREGTLDGTVHAHSSEDGIELMDLKCPDRIFHAANNSSIDSLRILVHKLVTKLYP